MLILDDMETSQPFLILIPSFVQSAFDAAAFHTPGGDEMLQNAMEPIVTQLLTNLIQLGAVLLFTALAAVWKTLHAYLVTHLSSKQMELLQLLGNQAYALIEAEYKQLGGSDKLDKGLAYIQQEAAHKGIPFNADAARGALEHAWMTAEGQFKKQEQIRSAKSS